MSKKYQHLARKRDSENYMEAQGTCNWGIPHHYITCKTCISRGVTRNKQQFYSRTYGTEEIINIQYNYIEYLKC